MSKFDSTFIVPSKSKVQAITIPVEIFDKKRYPLIKMSAALIYGYILALPREVDENGQEYVSFPLSEATEVFGCVPSTITTNMAALKKEGLIAVKHAGYGKARRYYILKKGEQENE